jgi:hypothetical protein
MIRAATGDVGRGFAAMNEIFTLLGHVIPPRLATAIGGVFAVLAGVLCVFNGHRVEGLLWRGPLLIAGGAALVWMSVRGFRRAKP